MWVELSDAAYLLLFHRQDKWVLLPLLYQGQKLIFLIFCETHKYRMHLNLSRIPRGMQNEPILLNL